MFRIYGQRNRRGSLAGFQPLRNHPEVVIYRKQKETDASPTLTAHGGPSTEKKGLAIPAHLTREGETREWDRERAGTA